MGAKYVRVDFIVLLGFQPSMAREELIWVLGTNPASGGESAGGRAGGGWKNPAGREDGAEGASQDWAGDLRAGWWDLERRQQQ